MNYSKLYIYCWSLVLLILSGCGSSDDFNVVVSVDGLGTQNVRVIYWSNDRVNNRITTAIDGKFTFSGVSEQPAFIELYTTSRTLIGRIIASNGDNIEASFKLNEPGYMVAKGNKPLEEYAKFVTQNMAIINDHNVDETNRAVSQYIINHKEDAVSPYLLLGLFVPDADVARADSLAGLVADNTQPTYELIRSYREMLALETDTVALLKPLSLYSLEDSVTTISCGGGKGVFLAISRPGDMHRDSIISRLNKIHTDFKTRLTIVELSTADDTTEWKAETINIKPQYLRCWEPGGVATRGLAGMHVRRVPWYVVADSTSKILYSGSEIDKASRVVDNRFTKN